MFPGSFTQPQQFVDAWTKMTAEQVARFEQMTAQYEDCLLYTSDAADE